MDITLTVHTFIVNLKTLNPIMKLLFIFLFALISVNVITQELRYTELNTGVKPKGKDGPYFNSYECKDGTVYKIGDTLTLGYPASNVFDFISNVSGGLQFLQAMAGQPVDGPEPLPRTAMGSKTQIKKIVLAGSKRNGYFCNIYGKGMLGQLNSTFIIQIENAIDAGEIRSSRFSNEDALNDLKKAKEKLDLQLITQEQYDSIKSVLAKFIK